MAPFDNDSASDWIATLGDAIPATLSLTFRPVIVIESDLYLEEPDASEAIAAAEVVAAMRGNPGHATHDNPDVAAWATSHRDWISTELVAEATAAVERVRAASELRDLWAETDELNSWDEELNDILRRLRA